MTELERAVGQFTVYRLVLEERAPDYNAYLRVFGFNPDEETITRWID